MGQATAEFLSFGRSTLADFLFYEHVDVDDGGDSSRHLQVKFSDSKLAMAMTALAICTLRSRTIVIALVYVCM